MKSTLKVFIFLSYVTKFYLQSTPVIYVSHRSERTEQSRFSVNRKCRRLARWYVRYNLSIYIFRRYIDISRSLSLTSAVNRSARAGWQTVGVARSSTLYYHIACCGVVAAVETAIHCVRASIIAVSPVLQSPPLFLVYSTDGELDVLTPSSVT